MADLPSHEDPAGLEEPPKQTTWTATAIQLLATLGPLITVGTALLFYFGWVRTSEEARYLGFDDSVLQMSSQDYVLRSASALFLPAALITALALAGLIGHGYLEAYRTRADPAGRRARVLHVLSIALLSAFPALLLFGGVLSAVFRPWAGLIMPAGIAMGLLLSTYGVVLRRKLKVAGVPRTADDHRRDVAAATMVGLLVVLSLFWGAGDYAAIVGRGLGRQIGTHLDDLTGVVLYSPTDLRISAPGVRVQVYAAVPAGSAGSVSSAGQGPAYGFRYEGLWLLQRSGGRLFLLPDGWTLDSGVLIVIPDNAAVRVEYTH